MEISQTIISQTLSEIKELKKEIKNLKKLQKEIINIHDKQVNKIQTKDWDQTTPIIQESIVLHKGLNNGLEGKIQNLENQLKQKQSFLNTLEYSKIKKNQEHEIELE